MSEHAAEDRTEAPTARRLQQAREAGQLPLSRDMAVFASLAGASIGAIALLPSAAQHLADHLAVLLGSLHRVPVQQILYRGQVTGPLLSALALIATVALPAALCGAASVLLQTGFHAGGTPIKFDFARIHPGAGMARLLSRQHLLDFLKACGRLVILILLIWSLVGRHPFDFIAALNRGVPALLPAALAQIVTFVWPLLVALACLAAGDVLLVRIRHLDQLRMTREEVRQEMKEIDGDPFIKAKLRRLRQQRSRRRMMAKVKAADVVVTNPTHYAVALTYDRQRNAAPQVVAKGVDFLAARIREEAMAHNVPIMPNPALARALYQVDLDREVPAEHYQAVAEVIAFVWKVRNRIASPVQ